MIMKSSQQPVKLGTGKDMDASEMKKSGGYTLVEVMVAMVISLIVLGGVYKAITDESINLAKDEAVLDMQNNARVALARIGGDLRRAGFFGCGAKKLSYPAGGYSFPAAIVFSNNDSTNSTIDDGTDAITLGYLGGDVPLEPDSVDDDTLSGDNFKLGRPAFVNGDTLLVTDCEEYAVFTKTNGSTTEPSATVVHADLIRVYGAPQPSRVYSFESSAYRVDGAELKLNNNVIAANIEDLQFEFISDSDNDGELNDEAWKQNLTGPPAIEIEDIRVIRVWVLAMSDTAYTYTDTSTYDYPNSPYYSTDNPFASTNGAGGSPAAQAGLANDRKHRYRYLASAVVYVRNLGII
jgi:type IV pilus assembly protein PilW